MRSILIALSLGIAAATVAYAHTADDTVPVRQAGTLVCHQVANVSLVVGTARLATCQFIDEKRTHGQVFGAYLPPRADSDETVSQPIAMRVLTVDGTVRAQMLAGRFTRADQGNVLRSDAVALAPIGATDEASIRLVATDTIFTPRPLRQAAR